MLQAVNLDRMGDLVMSIGSGDFGGRFRSLVHNALDVAGCSAFVFNRHFEPRSLIMEGGSEDARKAHQLVQEYIKSGNYGDAVTRIADGDFRADIYVICPEPVLGANHAYAVANEIVILGKVADKVYYIGLSAGPCAEHFSRDEIDATKRLSGFILRTLHRHHELACVDEDGDDRSTIHDLDCPEELRAGTLDHLRDVMIAGPHRLTPREAEICARIIMGYSAVAISLNLSISTHTVATHRKRAYAKMGILSLNELFVRYFSTVRDFQSRMMN